MAVLGPGGDRVGCLRAEAACPPEDCGGAPGYEQLCAVLADPGHPEHQDMLDFATQYPLSDPVAFDPAHVDPVAIDHRVYNTAGQVPATVRLLLDLADGVKLTPGGRLPRTVVWAVHDQYPSWYDLGRPASIEDDLPPLVALHTLLRRTGLLRPRHGILHATKASGDNLAVVRRLRTVLPAASFTTLVATTATALLTTGPQTPDTLARHLLPEISPGWSRAGHPIDAADITTEATGSDPPCKPSTRSPSTGTPGRPGPAPAPCSPTPPCSPPSGPDPHPKATRGRPPRQRRWSSEPPVPPGCVLEGLRGPRAS